MVFPIRMSRLARSSSFSLTMGTTISIHSSPRLRFYCTLRSTRQRHKVNLLSQNPCQTHYARDNSRPRADFSSLGGATAKIRKIFFKTPLLLFSWKRSNSHSMERFLSMPRAWFSVRLTQLCLPTMETPSMYGWDKTFAFRGSQDQVPNLSSVC